MANTAHHKGERPTGGKTRRAFHVFGKTANKILCALGTFGKGVNNDARL